MDQVNRFISEISGRSKSAEKPQRSEKSHADTKDTDPFKGMVLWKYITYILLANEGTHKERNNQ